MPARWRKEKRRRGRRFGKDSVLQFYSRLEGRRAKKWLDEKRGQGNWNPLEGQKSLQSTLNWFGDLATTLRR